MVFVVVIIRDSWKISVLSDKYNMYFLVTKRPILVQAVLFG